jgi:hypothetical protein
MLAAWDFSRCSFDGIRSHNTLDSINRCVGYLSFPRLQTSLASSSNPLYAINLCFPMPPFATVPICQAPQEEDKLPSFHWISQRHGKAIESICYYCSLQWEQTLRADREIWFALAWNCWLPFSLHFHQYKYVMEASLRQIKLLRKSETSVLIRLTDTVRPTIKSTASLLWKSNETHE